MIRKVRALPNHRGRFNRTTASGHLCFSSSQVLLSSDEDNELEENFHIHRVHVDIENDVD